MKVKPLAILISLALCLSLVAALASTHPSSVKANGVGPWHVATNGSDTLGNGTEGNPWQTIQHAIDNTGVGATIIVHPGIYDAANWIHSSHSADLTIQSSDGPGNTTIDGSRNHSLFPGFEIDEEAVV